MSFVRCVEEEEDWHGQKKKHKKLFDENMTVASVQYLYAIIVFFSLFFNIERATRYRRHQGQVPGYRVLHPPPHGYTERDIRFNNDSIIFCFHATTLGLYTCRGIIEVRRTIDFHQWMATATDWLHLDSNFAVSESVQVVSYHYTVNTRRVRSLAIFQQSLFDSNNV